MYDSKFCYDIRQVAAHHFTFLADIVVLGSKLASLKNQISSGKTVLLFEYFETPRNIYITTV